MSEASPPAGGGPDQAEAEPPDLVLQTVAFVRFSEGRVSSRGTAAELSYRRSAGRLLASQAAVQLPPRPESSLAPMGMLHLSAPSLDAETAARRGTGAGGVWLDSQRGDRARTDRVVYDGPADRVTSDTALFAQGPGYRVRSRGFVARADGSDVTLTGGVTGRLTEAVPEKAAPARRRRR